MLDGEKVSGKASNSLKTSNITGNVSTNNLFSSSDIEEEYDDGAGKISTAVFKNNLCNDKQAYTVIGAIGVQDTGKSTLLSMLAGPSTSSYSNSNGTTIDNLSHYTEDLDVKDHKDARQLFSEFRHLLDHDSVFHRIRSEILGDLDRMAQEQQATDNKQLTHRQRFEFLERLDDLLDTANDLNDAHMAVLRHVALQLSTHTPLEIMGNDFDFEHLFVVPEKQKENGVTDDVASPPKKVRKSRNADERKLSTATAYKSQIDTNPIKVGSTSQASANNNEMSRSKESKAEVSTRDNGLSANNSNGDKPNGRSDHSIDVTSKSIESEKLANSGRVSSDFVDIKLEDQSTSNSKHNSSSSKFDSDNSSNVDVKETRGNEKGKKMEMKKPFKKPINNKSNGISKTPKNEKPGNRRASERHGKSSRTPEPESKKSKRRATSSVADTASEISGRQSVQRRTTRNTQLTSELSNIDEQTYCLCDQISYGNMVCCDNKICPIEWFHFDCVGLKVKPAKGQKWYCPSCRGTSSSAMKSALKK